jgi:1-hydroxycarotenoid 3,4-desaturase
MKGRQVVVVGAGIAGLSAALALAARGLDVIVVERSDQPGGKMREVELGGRGIDSGPTVFTMRWVFDALLGALGEQLEDHIGLQPLSVLARHAWADGSQLDLYADEHQTADAIGWFAGRSEAEGFKAFSVDAKRIFDVLRAPFICSPAPSMTNLLRGARFRDLSAIRPFQTMWKALGGYFTDPRLRQLFGRYATYCGSSPFDAPATLMLVAHVESAGVWLVDGGMYRLAAALSQLAVRHGVHFVYGAGVSDIMVESGRASGVRLANGERIESRNVIATADVAALALGLLGRDVAQAVPRTPEKARSLSAMTWSCVAAPTGFPLLRHSVFFSRDYRDEFESLFGRRQMPQEPTVYICAQDRENGSVAPKQPERLFILANAPAIGDRHQFKAAEIDECTKRTLATLERCDLTIPMNAELTEVTTPTDFNRMFPGTGGALYGRSSHGWMASFKRPGARTKLPGLYLAGGSAHPGPGIPMAALSGWMAAASLIGDLTLTASSPRTAMPGGTSMH